MAAMAGSGSAIPMAFLPRQLIPFPVTPSSRINLHNSHQLRCLKSHGEIYFNGCCVRGDASQRVLRAGASVEEAEASVAPGGDEAASGELRFERALEVLGNSRTLNRLDARDDEADENLGPSTAAGELCLPPSSEFYVSVTAHIVSNMELVIVNWFCISSKNLITSISS